MWRAQASLLFSFFAVAPHLQLFSFFDFHSAKVLQKQQKKNKKKNIPLIYLTLNQTNFPALVCCCVFFRSSNSAAQSVIINLPRAAQQPKKNTSHLKVTKAGICPVAYFFALQVKQTLAGET